MKALLTIRSRVVKVLLIIRLRHKRELSIAATQLNILKRW